MTPSANSSGGGEADFSAVPLEVLTTAADKARRLIRALDAGDLADLNRARFETDLEASGRALDRNFARTQGARRALAKIETEINRRAALAQAQTS